MVEVPRLAATQNECARWYGAERVACSRRARLARRLVVDPDPAGEHRQHDDAYRIGACQPSGVAFHVRQRAAATHLVVRTAVIVNAMRAPRASSWRRPSMPGRMRRAWGSASRGQPRRGELLRREPTPWTRSGEQSGRRARDGDGRCYSSGARIRWRAGHRPARETP